MTKDLLAKAVALLAFLACCQTTHAATHIKIDITAFAISPYAGRKVVVQPVAPFKGSEVEYTTDSNGIFYRSNELAGDYALTVKAKGQSKAFYYQYTVTTNETGVVDASTLLSVPGVQTYPETGKSAWSIKAADGRYLKLSDTNGLGGGGSAVTGTNLARASTNSGVVTINVETQTVQAVSLQDGSLTNNDARTVNFKGDQLWLWPSGIYPQLVFAQTNATPHTNGIYSRDGKVQVSIGGDPGTESLAIYADRIEAQAFVGSGAQLTGTATNNTTGSAASLTAWFNVEHFGAVVGADSTLSISNAIRAAELSGAGAVVYFPSNNYKISAPLYIRSNSITLLSYSDVGSAQFPIGTITNTGTGDSIIITNYPTMPNGIKIQGVNLTANSRGTGSVGIRAAGDGTAADQLGFSSFEINGFSTGVLLSNVANSVFTKVSVAYCDVGWHSEGTTVNGVNHSLTWLDCPVGESGIGFLLKNGWAHILGCDIIYLTNAISGQGARILLQNVNMEISPSAVNANQPAAIKLIATVTSGFPTFKCENVRVSSYSGEALTNSYSVVASNYVVRLDVGNLFLMNANPSASTIAEYNTIPSLVTDIGLTRGGGNSVTNITAGLLYKARAIPSDLSASGATASVSTWGDQFYNLRASSANDQWLCVVKTVAGYRTADLFDFHTQSSIYNRLFIGTNAGAGYSGAGWTDGLGGLDIASTRFLFGAENNNITRANGTAKLGYMSLAPYAIANPKFTFLAAYAPSGINQLTLGGGETLGQAATEILFRAASSVTTGAGSVVGRITSSSWAVGPPLYATNGIAFPNGTISLTADNQVVGTTTNAVLSISSDNGTAGNRTFVLTTAESGRIITLTWTGTNAGELVDDAANSGSGNVRLSATWTPTQYDTIQLLGVGADWHEVSRSDN